MEESASNNSSGSGGVGSNKIEFDQLDDGLTRIIKKQKTCLNKAISDIDTIISSLKQCKQVLSLAISDDNSTTNNENNNNNNNNNNSNNNNNNNNDQMMIETPNDIIPKAISKLNQSLIDSKFCTKLVSEHKELHAPISKFGKVVDKNFRNDIEKSTKDIGFDTKILNKSILNHLYRVGKFEIGDIFANEIGIDKKVAMSIKECFIEHHRILESIEQFNLKPVIEWCRSHRELLSSIDSSLEFKLHRLHIIQLLKNQKSDDALQYARDHLEEFSTTHMKDLQQLMGTFLFAKRLDQSPYKDIFEQQSIDDQWFEIKNTFSRDNCSLMGLPQESPLSITITVGIKSLPTLLKLSSFSVLKGVNDDSLTVEINVDEKYKFHSVFACPVSREQSTPQNPPVMLLCGHLLCKNSMQRLLKGSSNRFKCPYCPAEQNLSNVKTVYF
ncbi:hypothetical protein RB653_001920 [Dictyostelium firmibasis]|uniref:Uncharacterized protein n=1 Tax=Dictyostelium firmibasis TaxID=79012 RepID=A0AAN7TWV1_9MYCE